MGGVDPSQWAALTVQVSDAVLAGVPLCLRLPLR
jgi:hypothetical protein